jgi:hypothetical protein
VTWQWQTFPFKRTQTIEEIRNSALITEEQKRGTNESNLPAVFGGF